MPPRRATRSPSPAARLQAVWAKSQPLMREEQQKSVLDVDVATPSGLLADALGWVDQKNRAGIGLQADRPFRRTIFPAGGLPMVEARLGEQKHADARTEQ
jgi:formate C-acetyltransferase